MKYLITILILITAPHSLSEPTSPDLTLADYYGAAIKLMGPHGRHKAQPRVLLVKGLTYNKRSEDGVVSVVAAVGLCRRDAAGTPHTISFDVDFWSTLSYDERLTLMAHEVAHCLYDMEHTDGGLMDPYIENSFGAAKTTGTVGAIRAAMEER